MPFWQIGWRCLRPKYSNVAVTVSLDGLQIFSWWVSSSVPKRICMFQLEESSKSETRKRGSCHFDAYLNLDFMTILWKIKAWTMQLTILFWTSRNSKHNNPRFQLLFNNFKKFLIFSTYPQISYGEGKKFFHDEEFAGSQNGWGRKVTLTDVY